jgi:hypothetical protein
VLIIVATAALAVSACGGDTNEESASGTAQKQSSQSQQAKTKCQRASRRLLDAIETGLTVTRGGNLRRGYIVQSKDFEKVYMVAADIQGSGMQGSDDIGVWATNSPQGEGVIYAVDGFAQEFSDWGDADKIAAAIDQTADGVEEARSCAKG